MTELEITFNNKIDIRTQAQVFFRGELADTCMVNPGETCVLSVEPGRYNIYLKNSVTGWEITHKLDCKTKTLTLSQHKGRYVIS